MTPTTTPQPSTSPTTSADEPTPTSQPEQPTAKTSKVYGWAYVNVMQSALFNAPGGLAVSALQAGDKLEILGRSDSGRWLKVRYQPDGRQPVEGWVSAYNVVSLVDVNSVPVVEANAQPPATAVPAGDVVANATVKARSLNLRQGPGLDQTIIDRLSQGEIVDVFGRSDNGEWLQVRTPSGVVGWAAANWLEVSSPPEQLPVVGEATTAVPQPAASSPAASESLPGRILIMESPGGAIYIMNADGSDLHMVTAGLDPTFNSDGSKIALARWDGTQGLFIRNLTDDSEYIIKSGPNLRFPSWSPDDKAIAYEHPTMAWECRDTPLGCYTDQQIIDFFGGNECRDFGYWGKYCLSDFPPKGIHYMYGVQEIQLDGGHIDDVPAPPFAYAPEYHPTKPEMMLLLPDGIGIAPLEPGVNPRKVVLHTAMGAPIYSPDGQYIYVSQKTGDHWDIWRYNEDGSNPLSLTKPPALRDRPIHNVAPAVSPDGRYIIFLTNREGDGSAWKLWIMNSDGSNQHPLAPEALANINFQFNFGRERFLDWQ